MWTERGNAHPLQRVGGHGSRGPLHLTAAGLLLVNLLRPVHDSDLFWQLKAGELTLAAGWPPAHEPFLADKLDTPFVPVAWLGQAVYAGVRLVGGYPLLHVVDGLVWVGGWWLAAVAARRHGASVVAVCLAMILANWTAYSSVSTRPQTFALFAFGGLIALVRQPVGWRTVAAGLGLLILWQNLHPSAAVGVAYLGAVTAVGWGRWLLGHGSPPGPQTVLAGASPLTLLATPGGAGLLRAGAYNADVSLDMGVNEWQSLWALHVNGDWRPEAVGGLLAFVGVLVWRGRRAAAEEVVAAVVFAGLAVASYRFVMFFAAAAVPVWACGFAAVAGRTAGLTPVARRWLTPLAWSLAIAVPTLIRPTHLADYVPFTAMRQLREEGVHGTLYTNPVWAGVVIDTGYPDRLVTQDGRYYLRSKAEWAGYHAAAAGQVSVDDLDRRWHPTAFVLRVGFDDGLIDRLRGHPGWRELPPDKACVCFVRASPAAGR